MPYLEKMTGGKQVAEAMAEGEATPGPPAEHEADTISILQSECEARNKKAIAAL